MLGRYVSLTGAYTHTERDPSLTNPLDSNSGIAICIGGPALVQSLRPTDDQLFKRYNPELQKRSLEEGDRRAQDFDNYVNQLKEWSKSDKSSMLVPVPVCYGVPVG